MVNGKVPIEEDTKRFVQTYFIKQKVPVFELVKKLSTPPIKHNVLVKKIKNPISKTKSKPQPAPQPTKPQLAKPVKRGGNKNDEDEDDITVNNDTFMPAENHKAFIQKHINY